MSADDSTSAEAVLEKIPVKGTDVFKTPADTVEAFKSPSSAERVKAAYYIRKILSAGLFLSLLL